MVVCLGDIRKGENGGPVIAWLRLPTMEEEFDRKLEEEEWEQIYPI